MNQRTLNIILLAAPIVIGGLIAAINANGINDTTEKVEAWTRKRQQGASVSSGWFSNYIINPLLWVIVKFCDWTDGFTHHGLKNGIRIAATLYLIAAWLFILYVAFMIAVVVVITIAILYVVVKVLAGLGDNEQERSDATKTRAMALSEEEKQKLHSAGQAFAKEEKELNIIQSAFHVRDTGSHLLNVEEWKERDEAFSAGEKNYKE